MYSDPIISARNACILILVVISTITSAMAESAYSISSVSCVVHTGVNPIPIGWESFPGATLRPLRTFVHLVLGTRHR